MTPARRAAGNVHGTVRAGPWEVDLMADAEPEPMQAGVVNVLLTIDPVASHAAGTYLTWDGAPFDEEQTARCDAAG